MTRIVLAAAACVGLSPARRIRNGVGKAVLEARVEKLFVILSELLTETPGPSSRLQFFDGLRVAIHVGGISRISASACLTVFSHTARRHAHGSNQLGKLEGPQTEWIEPALCDAGKLVPQVGKNLA